MYAEDCMGESKPVKKPDITIRDLYPDFNEEQLKEAEENLKQYAEIAWRIFQRIKSNPDAKV